MTAFLGKLLFPRQQPDVQRRKVNMILAVVFVSLLLGGLITLAMVLGNKAGAR